MIIYSGHWTARNSAVAVRTRVCTAEAILEMARHEAHLHGSSPPSGTWRRQLWARTVQTSPVLLSPWNPWEGEQGQTAYGMSKVSGFTQALSWCTLFTRDGT